MRTHKQIVDMYNCYNRSLIKSLKIENIHFIKPKDLKNIQLDFIRDYYNNNISPVLTPMIINKNQPEDPIARAKVMNILDMALLDNSKSRALNLDGTYSKINQQGRERLINSQEIFISPYSSEKFLDEVAAACPEFIPVIS